MKNSPSGKLALNLNPFKKRTLAQPADIAAPSFNNNPEDSNQELLDRSSEILTLQTNHQLDKSSPGEKIGGQVDSSQTLGNLFPEREDQSSQHSKSGKMKASHGVSPSNENNEIPKKNNYQHLPPIQKITNINRDEDEVPNRSDRTSLLIKKNSNETERENDDKSPGSAVALIKKQIHQNESSLKENKSEKKESAFKKGINRINPEMELVTLKPTKDEAQDMQRKKGKQISVSPTPAEPLSQEQTGIKLASAGLTGEMKLDTEDQSDDEEESDEGRSPTGYKIKQLGTRGKERSKQRSKSFIGLNYREEKSVRIHVLT